MSNEFGSKLLRVRYHVAGQAAVAVAVGAEIRRAWTAGGGGVSVDLTGRAGRDCWQLAHVALGGAAACCLFRSPDLNDARECLRIAFRVQNVERPARCASQIASPLTTSIRLTPVSSPRRRSTMLCSISTV